jgi:hypothetical protein
MPQYRTGMAVIAIGVAVMTVRRCRSSSGRTEKDFPGRPRRGRPGLPASDVSGADLAGAPGRLRSRPR